MGYLFQHLRPEFVVKYPKRLCSDAFSPFIILKEPFSNVKELVDEVNMIHKDIKEATQFLFEKTIPGFVDVLQSYEDQILPYLNLTHELHFYGINVRFLGKIFSICEKRKIYFWSYKIVVEMIARVLKDKINRLLRDKMKEFRYTGEGIYRREVIDFLNLIFSDDEESNFLWNHDIYHGLLLKFENSIGSL